MRGSWDEWKEGTQLHLLPEVAGNSKCSSFCYLARLSVPNANVIYEYKFIVDEEWINDSKKAVLNGNHFIEIVAAANIREEFSNLILVRQRFLAINQTLNSQYPFVFYSRYDYGFLSIMRETPDKNSFYFLITRTDLANANSIVTYLSFPLQLTHSLKKLKNIH